MTRLVGARVRGQAPRAVSSPEPETGDHLVPLRDDDGRPIVSPRLLARVRAIAEALFMTHAGPPPAERLDWLVREAEDFLARAGARSRFVVGLATFVVGLLAPLVVLRFVPLARMPVRERARALSALEDRFGAPVLAVKAMLCILYYEHPDAASAVGFDGRCLTDGRPPRLPVSP